MNNIEKSKIFQTKLFEIKQQILKYFKNINIHSTSAYWHVSIKVEQQIKNFFFNKLINIF